MSSSCDEAVVVALHLDGHALTTRPGTLTSLVIDEPAARGPNEPAARIGREALSRPVVGGRDQRLLDRVLGGIEIARPAGQDGEDLRREVAQQVLGNLRVAQRTPPAVSR